MVLLLVDFGISKQTHQPNGTIHNWLRNLYREAICERAPEILLLLLKKEKTSVIFSGDCALHIGKVMQVRIDNPKQGQKPDR
jgi:hypothetical protein